MSLLSGINIDEQGQVQYPTPGRRRRWILRIMLLIILLMGLVFAPRLQSTPLITTLNDGVRIEDKTLKEPIILPFSSTLEQVRALLGDPDAHNEGLLVYNKLGLSLYVDEQAGLNIVGYFNDSHQLNPLDVPGRWQVGSVRLEAGFAGVRFNQLVRKMNKEFSASKQDGYNVHLRYEVLGNTLRLEADERGRLAFIAYHYGTLEI